MRIYIILITLAIITSCVPPTEENELDIKIDLATDEHRSIIEAMDRRDSTAIAEMLKTEDITKRFLAVQSCASVQSKSLAPQLIEILSADESHEIREQAAYALGQLRSEDILPDLIAAFGIQDTSSVNNKVRGAILEAIGKCGDQTTLDLISTAAGYRKSDNHLLLGQARAIYRFGLRNIYSEAGTNAMIQKILDTGYPPDTRLIAAHYIARNPGLDISDNISQLTARLISEQDVDVRIALAGAITSRGDVTQAPVILSLLKSEPDYRVQINILRNLSGYNYNIYRDDVIALLDHENDHIFEIAANLLKNSAPRQDSGTFMELGKSATSNARKAQLLGIALNALPAGYVNTRRIVCEEIIAGLEATNSATDQTLFLKALALDPINLSIISEKGLQSTNAYVRSNTIQSLRDLFSNPRTTAIYNRPSEIIAFRSAVVRELTPLIDGADPGAIAAISSLLKDEQFGFKEEVGLNLTLRAAMRKMQIPEDYEAKLACIQALNYLEDTTYVLDELPYSHPIDWTLLDGINDSSRAYIITTKGQIEIQLFKNSAPGSVSNFVGLSQDNFYDSKSIHRVVPNFVIQGGCPRGDGYGSLDYTIRSELGPRYYDDEGFVGMASAGKDTEGTQWFVTHSPTPHLDGRYTIFGKVTTGMEVVHNIRVGDIIQDVRILKF